MREFLSLGDYYYAHLSDECIVLKIVNKGNKYNTDTVFSVVDVSSIVLPDDNQLVATSGIKDVAAMGGEISIIAESLKADGRFDENGNIVLYPYRGLFRETLYDNKKIQIPNIINSNDVIIDNVCISFFESYYLCAIDYDAVNAKKQFPSFKKGENAIVFRKLKDVKDIFKWNNISNELQIDARQLQCAYSLPFKIINKLESKYVNASGIEYNYFELLKFISDMVCKSDRSFNRRMIVTYFSRFYQDYHDTHYDGFSSEEIGELIDKYLNKDVVSGYYYFFDTLIKQGDSVLMYDKEWFRIFYECVHKSKKELHRCSEFKVPNGDKRIFGIYTIMPENMKFFVAMAKQCVSLKNFYISIENYLKSKLEVNYDD